MSLFTELGIEDPTKVNLKEESDRIASGGLTPKGVHHAVLEGASQLLIDGVKCGYKLSFKVIAGPGKDGTVEDVVWLPKGNNENTDKKLRTRALMYGQRLGLLKAVKTEVGAEVPTLVEGKTDFCDCLGALCFIDVIHEEETYEKDGKKKQFTKAKLAYEGILKPDDKKVTNIPRATSSQVAAAATAKPATATKPGDQFADL